MVVKTVQHYSKKRILYWALCALLFPLRLFAAQYADDCPCDLYLHQHDGGFAVGAELLYLGAGLDQEPYALLRAPALSGERFKSQVADAGGNLGFSADVSYLFPGTAYDARAKFTSYVIQDSASVGGGGVVAYFSDRLGVAQAPDLVLTQPVEYAKGRTRVDMTDISFLFGQTVETASERVRLKWLLGARSSTLHTKTKALYTQGGGSGVSESLVFDSEFTGMGPTLGAQGVVKVWRGLQLNTEVSTSFLLGKGSRTIDNAIINTDVVDAEGAPLLSAARHAYDYDDKLVPVIDMRVGLLYTSRLRNESELGLEIGFQASQYIDSDFRFSSSGTDVGVFGLFLRAAYQM